MELRRDVDRGANRAVNRAAVLVEPVDPFGRLPVFGSRFQVHADMDAADHQNPVFGFDLAHGVGGQAVSGGGYLARLQRATQGSRQSARGRRDNVVERRRVRL